MVTFSPYLLYIIFNVVLGDRSSADTEDGTVVASMIKTLQEVKIGGQGTERRQCMTQLIRMARNGTTGGLIEHFRNVLRVLLENLEDSEGATRALVFGVLTEMLKQESLLASFHGFTELVILKVLQAHKDQEKDVSYRDLSQRMAESTKPLLVIIVTTVA